MPRPIVDFTQRAYISDRRLAVLVKASLVNASLMNAFSGNVVLVKKKIQLRLIPEMEFCGFRDTTSDSAAETTGAVTTNGSSCQPRRALTVANVDWAIEVVLATGLPEELCRKIGLGYLDPKSIDPADYRGREAEGVLCVPRAGERLYRLGGPPSVS